MATVYGRFDACWLIGTFITRKGRYFGARVWSVGELIYIDGFCWPRRDRHGVLERYGSIASRPDQLTNRVRLITGRDAGALCFDDKCDSDKWDGGS